MSRRLFTAPALRCAVVLAVASVLPVAPATAAAYSSPFAGDSYQVSRTDMGVDFCLTPGAPIRAVGTGVVTGILPDWYDGQPYIWYQLTSGPDAGRYIYVAEQINHLARPGQTLRRGQIIARFAKSGSCIETGWSAADGATWAQATTGYTEGEVTPAGVSFAHFLLSLGVSGNFELTPPGSSATAKPKPVRHRPRPSRSRRARSGSSG